MPLPLPVTPTLPSGLSGVLKMLVPATPAIPTPFLTLLVANFCQDAFFVSCSCALAALTSSFFSFFFFFFSLSASSSAVNFLFVPAEGRTLLLLKCCICDGERRLSALAATSSVELYPLNTTEYTRFSSEPPTEVIRAGYHLSSPLYLARHSSPAAHAGFPDVADDEAAGVDVEAPFVPAERDEEAALLGLAAARLCSVREMSSLSSSASEVSSWFDGSDLRACSTCSS